MRKSLIALLFLIPASLWAGNITQPTFNQGVTSIQARITPAGGAYTCSEVQLVQLSAYWNLDENTGTNAADVSTGTHAGTLTNGPQWTPGTCGSGLLFTAADSEYVALADDGAGIIGTILAATQEQFTVTAWVKSTLTTTETVYSEGNTGSDTPFIYLKLNDTSEGTIGFGIRDDSSNNGSFITADINVNDGAWHHVAIVQTATNAREIFMDGASQGTNATSVDFSAGQLNVANIGRFERTGVTQYFDGTIDQVRVYAGRALSEANIDELVAEGK